jgi:prepilin-type N-terminal cleavage/methylation domain-containing protein
MRAGGTIKCGFTIVELIVVVAIISMLMAIVLPAISGVRKYATAVINMNNQKQITTSANVFALDNDDQYPDSVATVGFDNSWNWTDPTRLTGSRSRSPGMHRAMSEYLRGYIQDAETMYCPHAPNKYKYLQQAWDAGDKWDNPDTTAASDSLGGTYCFYWNYVGCLEKGKGVFSGPPGPSSSRPYSRLLVSDYFGHNNWRSPNLYGSCEPFDNANITSETWLLSSYWSGKGQSNNPPKVELHAGYTDGHVETYTPAETIPMKVSLTADGLTPYPDSVGPGIYYLPRNALY